MQIFLTVSHSSPVLLANLGSSDSSGRLTLRQTTFAPMIIDESDESAV